VNGHAVLAGIEADAAALAASLGSLRPADFARPTPCAAWDVAHLVAHLYRDFERVPEALAARTTEPADTDWLSYWSYDRPTNQVQTQDRAGQILARFETPSALVRALAELLADALGAARAAIGVTGTGSRGQDRGPVGNVRLPWGPVIAFDDFLQTRWVGLAVHSLDMADALGTRHSVSPEGLRFTAHTLDGLAGQPLSTARAWPAEDYIRVGTGRRELTGEEAAQLGPAMTARFPLLA
jgi:uncharacterized protein (TIGR03083 family)